MPNRPFSFYFRNDGGIARIMGVEPLDNNYTYHIKPGSGNTVEKDKPIKIDVHALDENKIKKGEFSFVLKYSDSDGDMYNLTVHVKKMSIKSMVETPVTETAETGLHIYSH
jgi:hypothetical protein